MREKRKFPSPVGEVLPRTLRIPGGRDRMKQWRFLARWEEIVGAHVAAHARPARFQGKTLVVRVEHQAWMTELSFLKPQMMERLTTIFPDIPVREIRFEAGELPPLPAPAGRSQKMPAPPPLSGDEEAFVERAIERIRDDGVRDAVRRAMARGIKKR